VEVAKQEFNRADEQLLEDLKQAVKEGRFKVDPDRLAARLVEDAFHDLDEVR
jgi:anti-sigma28 factor (negative regulator of flagellin synthesis)